MTQKEQLMYLIREYHKGKYRSETFCNEFTRILCLEKDNSLSDEEEKLFSKSDEISARFSTYEEGIKTGCLFDEKHLNVQQC